MSINIICFGSPLIDIIVKVEESFLTKYSLKPKDAVTMGEEHKELFDEISHYNPVVRLGGSVTNTARILKWQLKDEGYTVSYFGSVGNDKYGELFQQLLKEEKINPALKTFENYSTGKVAVLIANVEFRCLVTDLGASQVFYLDDCEQDEVVNVADYVYFSAFFLRVNGNLVKKLVNNKITNEKKTIFFNLGAPFLIEQYPQKILDVCEYSDIVFGNQLEYERLMKVCQLDTQDLKNNFAKLDDMFISNRKRLFVVTRGQCSIYVFDAGQKCCSEFEIEPMNPDEIKDVNGAGDAFVGGFLAQFLKQQPVKACVDCGVFAAREVIKHVGCDFDKNIQFPR